MTDSDLLRLKYDRRKTRPHVALMCALPFWPAGVIRTRKLTQPTHGDKHMRGEEWWLLLLNSSAGTHQPMRGERG